MKYLQRNLLIFLFFLLTTPLFAQNVEFEKNNFPGKKEEYKEALRSIRDADKRYDQGTFMYGQALEFYLKANNFNANNAELNYKIGKCYLYSLQKKNAISYFVKAIKLNEKVANDIHFLLGRAYHYNYEFDKAIAEFQAFQKSVSPRDYVDYELLVKKQIDECNVGKQLLKDTANVKMENLGDAINTVNHEYSPIINADETMLIFTSRRTNTTGGEKDLKDNLWYEDIYISYKKDGKWGIAQNPGKPLNTELHDASIGLSPDGQKLFIYRGENAGDIFESELDGSEWGKPDALSNNINTDGQESSASFSFDGRTIFFTSNRDGGYGGRDIYMSKKGRRDRWDDAENLGAAINTPYDEDGVFMHPDGKTIYFSSKGHKSMGGYDIFKSVLTDGKWSEPENLGYPINTPDDEVLFTMSASGKHGYFSSFRPEGFGGKDIYMITFLEKKLLKNIDTTLAIIDTIKPKEISSQLTVLKGEILDEKGMPIKATISITDNKTGEVIANFESNAKTGKYLISLPSGKNYGITVNAENFLFHSENFDIDESSLYKEITLNIPMKKAEVGSKIVLNNIFFEFGKSTLTVYSQGELKRLITMMSDIPSLKIEISGHTDNIGSAPYNIALSESRAKSVADHLANNGVDKSRITYKGYGFAQPIAPNDNEYNRRKNRRTEFKVVAK